jgi:hypothetical protein
MSNVVGLGGKPFEPVQEKSAREICELALEKGITGALIVGLNAEGNMVLASSYHSPMEVLWLIRNVEKYLLE